MSGSGGRYESAWKNGRSSEMQAIVLKNSANVVVEHNIIRDVDHVYQSLDNRSSVKADGNTAKSRF